VVAAIDPFWVHLRTDRETALPPLEVDAAVAQRLLYGVPVRYLVLDATSDVRRYPEAVVSRYPSEWELVFATSGGWTKIYRRTRSGGPGGGQGARSPREDERWKS
jgi:hypothetical protein